MRANTRTWTSTACWIALEVGLVLCAWQTPVLAQTASDKAAADALFNEGRRLIDKGDAVAACAKFEASLARVPQLGTQIALASCFEKVGRTASAWAAFRAAASRARTARDKRAGFCEEHVRALESMLSMIAINVDAISRVDGLEVTRDGSTLTSAELGTPVPVDPGVHTITASAPGRVAWSTSVSIAPSSGVVQLSVPMLATLPVDDAPRRRRVTAYALGGAGIVVIGGSLIVGAVASSRWSAARSHCHDRVCDPTGVDLAGEAGTLGNISTVSFAAGAGLVVAGLIVLYTAPSTRAERAPTSTALRISPRITSSLIGLTISGGF